MSVTVVLSKSKLFAFQGLAVKEGFNGLSWKLIRRPEILTSN